ncbi:GGDEF domain-containing protein [Shewanella avicenniae]|uniref:diguanylate cyclase n=1 Tax=Shewanella avicenniae TaxID=2814294 RepID=A0ABX7QNT7_9GAMM|nr:GGDEF domain-containing protein [Shewanella avicenniae]QSX32550.1 GGDEF domain-containing protein [Shewanella avicenniae]
MDFLHTAEGYADTFYWPETPISHNKQQLDMLVTLQRLHASLDPRTVFASYGKQLQSALPLLGLTLRDFTTPLKWGRSKGVKLSRTVLINNSAVQLDYFLSMPLSISELAQLDTIEPLLCQPLANAYRHQKLAEQAMLDSLTGIGNRFMFNQAFKNATARAQRSTNNQVSLLIFDLDNFKRLNDSKGHREGDKALVLFAEIVRHAIRSSDQAFRLGGDEFVIIAEGKLESAQLIAERVLQQTADNPFLQQNLISCSIGISVFDKRSAPSAEQFFEAADQALYRAKHDGRNRYCVAA